MRGIDADPLEVLYGRGPEQIVTHAGDHENLSPAKPGGHRLIRSLPAKPEIELLAKNCFPGFREAIGKRSQVNIRATNHRDARTFRHNSKPKSYYHRVTENPFLLVSSL
jgi:hypothetical protein